MNAGKIMALVVGVAGGAMLVWSAYTVQFTKSGVTHNYVQFAGFAAVGIGAVLWHLGSRRGRRSVAR